MSRLSNDFIQLQFLHILTVVREAIYVINLCSLKCGILSATCVKYTEGIHTVLVVAVHFPFMIMFPRQTTPFLGMT